MKGFFSLLMGLVLIAILGICAAPASAQQCNVNSRSSSNSIDPAVSLQQAQIQAQLTQQSQLLQQQLAQARQAAANQQFASPRFAAPQFAVQAPSRSSTTATASASSLPPAPQFDPRLLAALSQPVSQTASGGGGCNSGGRQRLSLPRPLANRAQRSTSVSRSVAITRTRN